MTTKTKTKKHPWTPQTPKRTEFVTRDFQGLTKERYMCSAKRKEDNDGTKTTQQRDKWIDHLSENEVDHDYFTNE